MLNINIIKNGLKSLRKDLLELKQYLRQTLPKKIMNIGDDLYEYAKEITPIGHGEPPGGGDRPRPGTKYGDLKKGWKKLRNQRLQKLEESTKIVSRGEMKYSIAISHDVLLNRRKRHGRIILKTLESGSKIHEIHAKKSPRLVYVSRQGGFRTPFWVKHPGTTRPPKILSRIQQRGTRMGYILYKQLEKRVEKAIS